MMNVVTSMYVPRRGGVNWRRRDVRFSVRRRSWSINNLGASSDRFP